MLEFVESCLLGSHSCDALELQTQLQRAKSNFLNLLRYQVPDLSYGACCQSCIVGWQSARQAAGQKPGTGCRPYHLKGALLNYLHMFCLAGQ